VTQRYITLREDKFSRQTRTGPKSLATKSALEVKNKAHRRPLNGLEIFDDVYATLTVRKASGEPLKIKHTGGESLDDTYTSSMLVQSISESREEKQQMVPTFGDDYAYYFGQRPRMLNVSAVLPHAENFQWQQEFWSNYDSHLRGTKLVDRDARVYFHIDREVFEGYLINASTSKTADTQHIVQLQFTMHVTASAYTDALRNEPLAYPSATINARAFTLATNALPTSLIALRRGVDFVNRVVESMSSAAERRLTGEATRLDTLAARATDYTYYLSRPHDYVNRHMGSYTPDSTSETRAPTGEASEVILTDNLQYARSVRVWPQPRRNAGSRSELSFVDAQEYGLVDKVLRAAGSPTAQALLVGGATLATGIGIIAAAYEEYGDDVARIAGDGSLWSQIRNITGYLAGAAVSATVDAVVGAGATLRDEFTAAGYSFIGQTPPSASSDLDVTALPASDSVRASSDAGAQAESAPDAVIGLNAASTEYAAPLLLVDEGAGAQATQNTDLIL
jgi:hypothetical protein